MPLSLITTSLHRRVVWVCLLRWLQWASICVHIFIRVGFHTLWFRSLLMPPFCDPVCPDSDVETCFGTYNNSYSYASNEVDNAAKSWFWLTCNAVGFWQTGAPSGWPTIVSRLVTPAWYQRQCALVFPEAFSTTQTVDPAVAVNAEFKGWDVNMNRLFFANGKCAYNPSSYMPSSAVVIDHT